ncbi:hypothetical protein ACVME5_006632 [Bradyrhizobium liaoningense]
MDASLTQTEDLGTMSDDALRALIAQAKSLLATRENKRRNEALVLIRQLAKDHGLGIAIKQPGRKRGRPRKSEE